MNPWCDIHYWSKQYCEERLAEASRWRLLERAKVNREQRSGRDRVGLVWASVVSLLSGAGL